MQTLALGAIVGLFALLLASPASAFQCPKLVKQLQELTARRFDKAAAEGKQTAVQAQALHTAGKHAESEKMAKEALDKLGVKS